ncbi:linalool/nerolidol synthase [Solanum lycopersicum]|uniref:Linalool/nerolidol synthase n=2 Tax=Solanum lycopersicum TaxID=4081 RepID=G5CV39_SOLLC|nr:linalool/nerolidol synthase [Solanum lycopersicum]AEP82767.1 linalool/nerolidol synthase [Solanum lycopersicum]
MEMTKVLISPSQYLSMHIISGNIIQNERSIQVSCKSSNKWAVQEDLLRATSTYNQDGFDSTKFGLLMKDVKYALRTQINNNNNLVLVDTLQRMGIEHHFQQEIQSILQKEYEQNTCFLKYQNHHDISLCFRLLRQEGYHVSADVFKKLKNNDDGTFGLNLNQDVNGLIGLYEASQLGVEGEYILDEIAKFSGDHLNACLVNSDEARIIKETLKYPYHKSLSRWKAKSFINNFKGINGWGKSTLQELANMDYSITKEIHQHELIQVSRWWSSLGLAEDLKLLRDQPLKWYTWPMTMLTDPKMSQQRIELAKCISFVYVVDDIFDVYGTIEELTLFTQAVNRWELCVMKDLPEYMRATYKALYDTINSIGYNIYKIYGQNPTQNLRNAWANLCNAFLKEAKWFASGELPTTDEYLKNGLVSSGVHVVLVHMFYLLGFGLNNQNSIYLEDSSAMASSVATILRLWDDLGSAKDENQEGNDGSYIECYMKGQKNASIELAREYVVKLIEDEWKQLNKKHFNLMNGSLGSYSKASLNLARMVPLMYNYDDKQSLHVLQEYINTMLYDV